MKRISTAGALALVLALGAQDARAATILISADITASDTWVPTNVYVLTKVIYVTNGATLTILPGTTVRGEPESATGAHDPGTLVITRGAKINAVGTEALPIVFTNLADNNIGGSAGTSPYDNAANALGVTGTWGGLILLGRTYVANNSVGAPVAAREVQIEGLTPTGGLGLYGNGGNDDDDSGDVAWTSIRYGGFNLSANNEINGLTLGAVGRETDLHHIEVFQNKDDGVEFFGGTANIHHVLVASSGDDSLDYDEGYRGKVQFYFAMQGIPGLTDKSDKGGEHDGGNVGDGSLPFAIPTIYNATYVGLGQKTYTGKALNTGIHFRDNAGGRYYNSLFADFGGAPFLIEGGNTGGSSTAPLTSGSRSITAYTIDAFQQGPPSTFQLELEDNAFWCFGNGGTVPTGAATANGGDTGKEHHDNGAFSNGALDNDYYACATPLPIRELTRVGGTPATVPDPILKIDPRPATIGGLGPQISGPLGTNRTAVPPGGFFTPAPYIGAFGTTNWAACWTNMARLGYFSTCTGANSAVPDEVSNLHFSVAGDKTVITFQRPPAPGCTGGVLMLDVLRADDPSDFTTAVCIETDDTVDSTADDNDEPLPGEAFYYLARAGNACGEGSLGLQSSGAQRSGVSCP